MRFFRAAAGRDSSQVRREQGHAADGTDGQADRGIAAGAASLIRTIVSMASGEQAQPGALGKGIGLMVGGAVLCALKAIVTAVIGQDPTAMTFY